MTHTIINASCFSPRRKDDIQRDSVVWKDKFNSVTELLRTAEQLQQFNSNATHMSALPSAEEALAEIKKQLGISHPCFEIIEELQEAMEILQQKRLNAGESGQVEGILF
jgi:hypothetical protein